MSFAQKSGAHRSDRRCGENGPVYGSSERESPQPSGAPRPDGPVRSSLFVTAIEVGVFGSNAHSPRHAPRRRLPSGSEPRAVSDTHPHQRLPRTQRPVTVSRHPGSGGTVHETRRKALNPIIMTGLQSPARASLLCQKPDASLRPFGWVRCGLPPVHRSQPAPRPDRCVPSLPPVPGAGLSAQGARVLELSDDQRYGYSRDIIHQLG